MKNIACFIVAGLFLGWMIGMSSSPIVPAVISSLLTIILAATSVIGRFDTKNVNIKYVDVKDNMLPITILIVALSFGAASGVVTRTSGILNFSPLNEVDELSVQMNLYTKYGLDSVDIAKRIFESKYPVVGAPAKNDIINGDGSLHNVIAKTDCQELCMKDTSNVMRAIERSSNPIIRGLKSLHDKKSMVDNIHRICNCD